MKKQSTQKNLCIHSYMAESVVSFKGLASEESDDMKKVFSVEDHVEIKRIGNEVSKVIFLKKALYKRENRR